MRALTAANLSEAEAGSYYTIRGAGGPLGEYIAAVEGVLEREEIGKPQEWFTTKGYEVNEYARLTRHGEIVPEDKFQSELVFLMFPLDGLHIGKLAILRLRMGDTWFDDMVQNMRVVHG